MTRGEPAASTQGARRRWLRWLLLGLVALVVLALLAGGVLAFWSVRRPFPQLDGAATLPGLVAPVDVYRDDLGIATIAGSEPGDLYRAQGYVHAQDRFWQMDLRRLVAAGRLAEAFGPDQLETDRFLRTLGWERSAREELELLDAETRAALEAYAEGVNAYLAERPPRAVALEYTVLGLRSPDYRPERWEPVDTLLLLRLLAWILSANLEAELDRAVLTAELGAERTAALYPGPPEAAPAIVPDPAGGPTAQIRAPHEATPPEALPELDRGEPAPRLTGALAKLREQLAAVRELTGAREGVGSNSWVLAGERTATGAPLLANDPHLGIAMPSIWYENALRCRGCRLDVAGFSIPGAPGVVIGHNDRIAWGFTNLGADVQDLYLEQVHPEDPERYRFAGAWREMEVSEETLRAAGGHEETLRVRRTRHGPVLTGRYAPLEDLDLEADGAATAVSLRWTALEPTRTVAAVLALNRARDWEEFRTALREYAVPSQSVVYADVDGNIGYQAAGRVPVRSGGDGSMPVPGWTGDHEWVGEIPFEDLPSRFNPPEGLIVAANNPAAGPGYPHHLTADWDHGQRAARIATLLEAAGGAITAGEIRAIQQDAHEPVAEFLVPALLAVDDDRQAVRTAQRLLRDWDRQLAADSAGAAVHAAIWRELLAEVFHDKLPQRSWPEGRSRWLTVVEGLLDEPESWWWDDPETSGQRDRDAVLAAAMQAAVEELRERLGTDPETWRWGALHRAVFRHEAFGDVGIGLLERRFNRGPYPVDGGYNIVNATGWDAREGYEVVWLPSARFIADLGDLSRSQGLHTTGQSGHAYHPHYADMVERWQRGETRSLRWDLEAATEAAAHHLRLLR